MAALTQEQLDELREDFEFNDGDGDGRIDYAEFVELIALLDDDIDMEESALRIGFSEIDTDHDGAIEFDEFVQWWTSD